MSLRQEWSRQNILTRYWPTVKNRTLCTTENGFTVLASETARPGDLVCFLFGCENPILLRPAGYERRQVVGEHYIPGLMAVEALAGLLPEEYRLFVAMNPANWVRGYQNIATGEIQQEDPPFDISEYPNIGSEGKFVRQKILTKGTGDLQIQDRKPSTPARVPVNRRNLIKWGVQPEDFDLV